MIQFICKDNRIRLQKHGEDTQDSEWQHADTVKLKEVMDDDQQKACEFWLHSKSTRT